MLSLFMHFELKVLSHTAVISLKLHKELPGDIMQKYRMI
jgi:hypothetical protein